MIKLPSIFHLFLIVLIVGLTVKSDAKPTKRIFNGSVPELAPFVCLVFAQHAGETNGFLGSGSIIGPRHILTAAQLLVRAGSVTIYIGSIELASTTPITTTSFMLHPQYNPTTNANDIGIVVIPFSQPALVWSDTVQPIRLPPLSGTAPPTGEGIVMGFGFTSEAVPSPSQNVMQATLTVRPIGDCPQIAEFELTETHFCAMSADVPPSNVCPGDNGAGFHTGEFNLPPPPPPPPPDPPLTESEEAALPPPPPPPPESTAVLVGIASLFRFACNAQPQPTAFTSVSYFRLWIADMTGIGEQE